MNVLPVLLFIFGIVFLLLGWRWRNPPSKEIMTALKGLAQIKREINRLEDDLSTLSNKVNSKVHGLTPESPEWQRLETKLLEISKQQELDIPPEIVKLLQENQLQDGRVNKIARDPRLSVYDGNNNFFSKRNGQAIYSVKSKDNDDNQSKVSLPEKYRRVLELSKYDFTIPEISKRLGISQDAVIMVLRTHQRGGRA